MAFCQGLAKAAAETLMAFAGIRRADEISEQKPDNLTAGSIHSGTAGTEFPKNDDTHRRFGGFCTTGKLPHSRREWQPVGESNPSFQVENLAS
jgi:hypothetical protein